MAGYWSRRGPRNTRLLHLKIRRNAPAGIGGQGKKAKAISVSIEDRRTIQWHQTAASLEANQIQYLFGRRLREYSVEELGQFQVIADVAGGFSYAQYLSLFMERALGFLALNGSFYTLLQDVRSENGTNSPTTRTRDI